MKPDPTALVSKLTLAVLTLILACLIVLVVRSFREHPSGSVTDLAGIEQTTRAEESPSVFTPAQAPLFKRPVPVATKPPVPTNPPGSDQTNAAALTNPPLHDANVARRVSFGPTDHNPIAVNETLAANGSALLAGTVTLNGTPKPEIPINLGPSCGAIQPERVTTRHYVVGPNGELANVVVYIKSGLQRKFGPVQPGPLIDQVGCMFEPYVSGVVAGQIFQIRNSDPVMHSVHNTPKVVGNREYNIAQGTQGQVDSFAFSNAEMNSRIKCDVHPWMFAYVSVFDHPYFAVTDTNGFFQLPAQIPAGNYVIGASHLKLGTELTKEITLKEGEQRSIQFEFTIPDATTPQGNVVRSN